jgi:hypothetical protein
MADMTDQPRRRRCRFGLISLFVLVAVVGILACFWNPFPEPRKSNINRIKFGMTEADVAKLVGKPDRVDVNAPHHHKYRLGGEERNVVFENGKVARLWTIWLWPPGGHHE